MKKINYSREDFINQYPPLNLMNKKGLDEMYERKKVHLYVHIPYCLKKCDFCYYKSFETGRMGVPDEYVEALIKEIQLIDSSKIVLRSMYWGGGTPSLLSLGQMEKILACITKKFSFAKDFEFCCEVRPGNETTEEKLIFLKSEGLKRVSIGCQSLNKEVLRLNGRNHSYDAFISTYNLIKKLNFNCINVDIMTGMIGDNKNTFMETVKKLVELSPDNITIYKMQLYYNSKLFRRYRDSDIVWATDEQEVEIAREAYKYILDSGYEQADNFSFRKGKQFEHIHRTGTWNGEDMIGVGLSSHSCVGNFIYQNAITLDEYYHSIEDGQLPIYRAYQFSAFEEMVRHFVFGIKSCNYNLNDFKTKFGIDIHKIFSDEIAKLEEEDLIEINGNTLYTTMKGTLYADDAVRSILPFGQEIIRMGHRKR